MQVVSSITDSSHSRPRDKSCYSYCTVLRSHHCEKISSNELDTGRTVVFSGYMHGRIGAGGLLGSHEHTSLGTEILDNSRHCFQLILPDSDETELRAQQ